MVYNGHGNRKLPYGRPTIRNGPLPRLKFLQLRNYRPNVTLLRLKVSSPDNSCSLFMLHEILYGIESFIRKNGNNTSLLGQRGLLVLFSGRVISLGEDTNNKVTVLFGFYRSMEWVESDYPSIDTRNNFPKEITSDPVDLSHLLNTYWHSYSVKVRVLLSLGFIS